MRNILNLILTQERNIQYFYKEVEIVKRSAIQM